MEMEMKVERDKKKLSEIGWNLQVQDDSWVFCFVG